MPVFGSLGTSSFALIVVHVQWSWWFSIHYFSCQFNVQSFPCMDDLFYTILELYTLHVCFLKELVQAICTCTVRKKNPIVYYIYIVWKVTNLLILKYVALNCSIKIGTIYTMMENYILLTVTTLVQTVIVIVVATAAK